MAWIKTIDPQDADPELRELYEAGTDDPDEGVDHILQIYSLHPAGLAAHLALYRAVMAGTATLRKVDREMIALVVSQRNDCHY